MSRKVVFQTSTLYINIKFSDQPRMRILTNKTLSKFVLEVFENLKALLITQDSLAASDRYQNCREAGTTGAVCYEIHLGGAFKCRPVEKVLTLDYLAGKMFSLHIRLSTQ